MRLKDIQSESRLARVDVTTSRRVAVMRPLPDDRKTDIHIQESMKAGLGRHSKVTHEIRLSQKTHHMQSDDVMKSISVSWLGTSSSVPTRERNVSCTVVEAADGFYLVDCGEGSAVQLIRAQVDLRRVKAICITHLHGDHCFGLGAVLQAIDLAKSSSSDQTEDRTTLIFGPTGTAELIRVSMGEDFKTKFRTVELVVGEDASTRRARPLRTPSNEWISYHQSSTETDMRQLNSVTVERIHALNIADDPDLTESKQSISYDLARSPQLWRAPYTGSRLREESEENYSGRNYVAAQDCYWVCLDSPRVRVRAAQLQHRVPCYGFVFEELDEEGSTRKKVVILGDTIDSSPIAPLAFNCDLISHEATFRKGMEVRAKIAQHSTGYLAGAFAHVVRAKRLILTHFSARYRDVSGSIVDRRTGKVKRVIEPSPEEDQAEQTSAIKGLISEAREQYKGQIVAARDFFSIGV